MKENIELIIKNKFEKNFLGDIDETLLVVIRFLILYWAEYEHKL